MRFSEIQKKEVIDMAKGTFLGFVQDATIDTKTGKIASIHVGGVERTLFLELRIKDLKQIPYKDIKTIGKDIVLISKKDGNQ